MQIRALVAASLLSVLGLLVWSTPARAQDGFGLRFVFGSQNMTGDMSTALDGAVDAEFSIMVPVSFLRVGGGANWASFDMVGVEETWSQIRFHALVGFPYRLTERLRPYVEARYTYRRLRPEDDRYTGGEEKLLRDFLSSGSGFEGVIGTEITLAPTVALDVSGAVEKFSVSPDLSEEGLGPIDSGGTWWIHVGVSWFPLANNP